MTAPPPCGGGGSSRTLYDWSLRKIDQEETGAPWSNNLERFIDPPRKFNDILDHGAPLRATPRNAGNAGLSEGTRSDHRSGDLTSADNEVSGDPRVTLGHVTRAPFVSRENEIGVERAVDGVR